MQTIWGLEKPFGQLALIQHDLEQVEEEAAPDLKFKAC